MWFGISIIIAALIGMAILATIEHRKVNKLEILLDRSKVQKDLCKELWLEEYKQNSISVIQLQEQEKLLNVSRTILKSIEKKERPNEMEKLRQNIEDDLVDLLML